MTKSNIETLTYLVDNQLELVNFLKELKVKDRKELVPVIGKLSEKYNKRVIKKRFANGYSYTEAGDFIFPQKHRDLLIQAGTVCCTSQTQFGNNVSWNIIRSILAEHNIDNILSWHIPKWLNKCLNGNDSFYGMEYLKMIPLMRQNIVQLMPETIAILLSNYLITNEWIGKKFTPVYNVDKFEIYPETLEEHFWLLFDYQSIIHSTYFPFIEGISDGDESPWFKAIASWLEKGKIDRGRLLKACILTSTKGFNKAQLAWFFRLFKFLEPSKEELIKIQPELLSCLNSDSSIAINESLRRIKVLAILPAFEVSTFTAIAPQLLSAETKSIVNSTLIILGKIASKQKDLRQELALTALEALATEDAKIQERAAKLITKYAQDPSQIGMELRAYVPFLRSDAKDILGQFILEEEEKLEEDLLDQSLASPIDPTNEVVHLESFEELLYFISQVLDDNQAQDLELLLPAILKINQQLTADNVDHLNPVFIRALKEISNNYRWFRSFIYEAALCLDRFAQLLSMRFPAKLAEREFFLKKLIKEDLHFRATYPLLSSKIQKGVHAIIGRQFHQILPELKANKPKIIISTPTHIPCWIDPEILVQRLVTMTSEGDYIPLIDWQMAIFRLPLNHIPEIGCFSVLVSEKLDVYKRVLLYFYGYERLLISNKEELKYFLPAILAKNDQRSIEKIEADFKIDLSNQNQQYNWHFIEKKYQQHIWDTQTRKYKRVWKTYQSLQLGPLQLKGEKTKRNFSLKSWFQASPELYREDDLFVRLSVRPQKKWYYRMEKDTTPILMVSPTYPIPYLSYFIQTCLNTSDLNGTEDKRVIVKILEILESTWVSKDKNELVYLFLAAAFLCNHKVARELAVGLWAEANNYQLMDNQLLGDILGKLFSQNYAPLKRFTDQLSTAMFNISKSHNQALLTLTNAMIMNMNTEPMTNTKKLLEIYKELLFEVSKEDIPELPVIQLEDWKQTKSLRKMIDAIMQKRSNEFA